MAIASDVITKVRQNLVDPDANRWSDPRLLSLLNDALHYVALNGRYNPQQGWVRLRENQLNYDLAVSDRVTAERVERDQGDNIEVTELPTRPRGVVKLLRVEYNDKIVPFKTQEEMDKMFPGGWTSKTGLKPEYIVVGYRGIGHFAVYPTIEELGLAVDIDANSPYGVITSISYSEVQLDLLVGTGDIDADDILRYLKIIYVAEPTKVTALNQELDPFVDSTLVTVLPFYITSEAYKDNQDVENLNQSVVYWQAFQERLENVSIVRDGGTSDKIRETLYRSGVNA